MARFKWLDEAACVTTTDSYTSCGMSGIFAAPDRFSGCKSHSSTSSDDMPAGTTIGAVAIDAVPNAVNPDAVIPDAVIPDAVIPD